MDAPAITHPRQDGLSVADDYKPPFSHLQRQNEKPTSLDLEIRVSVASLSVHFSVSYAMDFILYI